MQVLDRLKDKLKGLEAEQEYTKNQIIKQFDVIPNYSQITLGGVNYLASQIAVNEVREIIKNYNEETEVYLTDKLNYLGGCLATLVLTKPNDDECIILASKIKVIIKVLDIMLNI